MKSKNIIKKEEITKDEIAKDNKTEEITNTETKDKQGNLTKSNKIIKTNKNNKKEIRKNLLQRKLRNEEKGNIQVCLFENKIAETTVG